MENLIAIFLKLNPTVSNDTLFAPIEKIIATFVKLYERNNFFSETYFLGNSISGYILFAVIFTLILVLMEPSIKLIVNIFKKLASKTSADLADKVLHYLSTKKSKSFISLESVIALFLSLEILHLSPQIQKIVNSGAIIFITIFIVSIIIDVVKYIINFKYNEKEDPRRNSLLLIFPIIKIAVWVLAGFFVLSNLGYDVTALLTGLGIGGVALALASQSFLGDLVSFVSIASDKPIEIGDYISINGIEGTVKKIGIKSTRIERNLGEEVVIPNSQITSSNLLNYKRLEKRRFDVVLGIDMKTSNEKLQMVPDIINKIVAENEVCKLIRCSLDTIGEFSYKFTAIVDVTSSDGAIFFKSKEEFIYKVRAELENNDIHFACPTMEIKTKE